MRTWKCGAVLALTLAACGGRAAKDTGGLSLSVSVPGLGGASSSGQALTVGRAALTTPPPDAAGRVASVVLTHTGPDGGGTQTITNITNPITQIYNALPVGIYTFSATAYDASDPPVALFSGQVQVEVVKNQVAAVNLVLQQVVTPGTVQDAAPFISSIVVSNSAPATGETITLTADVIASVDLTYQWTASCSGQLLKNGQVLSPSEGEVFSDPTSKSTSFTSYCTADETITFSATQASETGGGSAVTSFTMRYSAQGGSFTISFNSWPDILAITATGTKQPAYGGTVTLAATVQDANGDAMTTEWKDNCGGSFADPASLATVWTAPQKGPEGTRPSTSPIACALRLSVTDGKGGTNSGWLGVHVGQAAVRTIVKRYAVPRFAYVVNRGDNTVAAYTVNGRTGALTPAGAPAVMGTSPRAIAVAPSNRFALVVHSGDNTVAAYSVDPSTGALASAGPAVATGTAPAGVAIHPSGKFAYVTNMSSANVSIYSLGADGVLGSLGTAPAQGGAETVAIDPSGKFLYVANNFNNTISVFSIDAGTGALTRVGAPVRTARARTSLAIDPASRFLYAAHQDGQRISVFRIDQATGALSSASTLEPGTSPYAIAVDPSGKFLYVSDTSFLNRVSAYAIDSMNGTLTSIGDLRMSVKPYELSVDPSGKFVYVANQDDNTVSVLVIDPATGALSAAEPATAGASPAAVATIGVHPPPFAYVANHYGASISSYSIDTATGAPASTGPETAAPAYPWHMAVDPQGRFLFVVSYGDRDGAQGGGGPNSVISAYAIDPGAGALTMVGSVAEPYANHLAVDPAGKFLYSSNNSQRRSSDPPAKVATYAIDQGTGALTRTSAADTDIAAWSVAVDPSGKFVYELSYYWSRLTAYRSDASTGALTSVGQAKTPAIVGCGWSHDRIAIDPFGRFLYELNCTGYHGDYHGSVGAFAIDPMTGALSLIGESWSRSSGYGVVVDPSGRFVYVGADDLIDVYSADPTGVLTLLNETRLPRSTGNSVAFDPSGQFLYVTNHHDSVTIFSVDSFTGALTPVGGPVATGSLPRAIVTTPGKAPWVFVDAQTNATPAP
jgi:YVTN family beta-propeller protein